MSTKKAEDEVLSRKQANSIYEMGYRRGQEDLISKIKDLLRIIDPPGEEIN